MKTSTIIKLAVWFISFLILFNIGLGMISSPNTIENVIGFFIVVLIIILSVKTKCLTNIKLEIKKDGNTKKN